MSTNIEWAKNSDGSKGMTWNPVTGCTRVSAGCDNCYATTMTHRLAMMGQDKYAGLTVLNERGDRHFNGKIKLHEDALLIPLKRKKPTTWFVNSMSDLFHDGVPIPFIQKVFYVMSRCPQHTFQILTKRMDRMLHVIAKTSLGNVLAGMTGQDLEDWPLPNVWLGVSVEQGQQWKRVDALKETPAAIRFISYEPALEAIDIESSQGVTAGWKPDWIICGGESGRGARRFDLKWARHVVQQCRASGVKVFVKQLGSNCWDGGKRVHYGTKGQNFADWPADLQVREMPEPRP